MIKSYACKDTETLFREQRTKRFSGFARQALKKLLMLDAATIVEDLRSPPGNRLEALKGDRRGQYSIRINDQYRVCFEWHDGDAHNVEITDYH